MKNSQIHTPPARYLTPKEESDFLSLSFREQVLDKRKNYPNITPEFFLTTHPVPIIHPWI